MKKKATDDTKGKLPSDAKDGANKVAGDAAPVDGKKPSLWSRMKKGWNEASTAKKTMYVVGAVVAAAAIAFSVLGVLALAGVSGAVSVFNTLGLASSSTTIPMGVDSGGIPYEGSPVTTTSLSAAVLPATIAAGVGGAALAAAIPAKVAYDGGKVQRGQEISKAKGEGRGRGLEKDGVAVQVQQELVPAKHSPLLPPKIGTEVAASSQHSFVEQVGGSARAKEGTFADKVGGSKLAKGEMAKQIAEQKGSSEPGRGA